MRRLVALVLLVGLSGACSFGGSKSHRLRPRRLHAATPGGAIPLPASGTRRFSTRSSATPAPTVRTESVPRLRRHVGHGPHMSRRPTAGSCVRRSTPTTCRRRARRRSATRIASCSIATRQPSGLQETFDELVSNLEGLCYRLDYVETEGDSCGRAREPHRGGLHRARSGGRRERAAPLRGSDLQVGPTRRSWSRNRGRN